MTFQDLTGAYFDSVCQSAGIRPIRVRYGTSIEILPRPLVSHDGVQSTSEITSPLNEGEAFDGYTVTIPESVLSGKIGASWRTAIGPNQTWYIQRNTAEGWVKCRVLGTATTCEGQRWGFKLVVGGLSD